MPGKTSNITPAMNHAFVAMLTEFGGQRFRLSDLSERILPLTRPRNRHSATALASKIFKAAADNGTIQRTGHLHWVAVSLTRKLRSGREVACTIEPVSIALTTRCPGKWLLVDAETGQSFTPGMNGRLRAADKSLVDEVKNIL